MEIMRKNTKQKLKNIQKPRIHTEKRRKNKTRLPKSKNKTKNDSSRWLAGARKYLLLDVFGRPGPEHICF